MKQAGKVSPLTLIISLAVIAGVIILVAFSSGDTPETAAKRFMTALATNNVDQLAKLSFMGDEPADQVRKEWAFAVKDAAPYYHFEYQLKGSSQPNATGAAVRIEIVRNFQKPGSYPEDLEIPMVKQGDDWKVDVRSMDKTIFPALPR